MKELNIIEQIIGYKFDNKDLLQQAFVRKSYSEENGGQNNEVLEFIGDKALDLAVIRIMMDEFGEIITLGPKFLRTKYDEGKLTDIKKGIVNKFTLAEAMDKLGFNKYLIMGKGDIKLNRQYDISVKEDLFESIIGAVALDSKWNIEIIVRVVKKMFDFDAYFNGNFQRRKNYVGLLQEYYQSYESGLPLYQFMSAFDKTIGESLANTFENGSGIKKCQLRYNYNGLDLAFNGYGDNNAEAKENCAEGLYNWLANNFLTEEPVLDAVGPPDEKEAIRQLNELYQKKMISEPIYSFTQCCDEDGNFKWECDCYVDENNKSFCSRANTKKEAQRLSAFNALCDLIDNLKSIG